MHGAHSQFCDLVTAAMGAVMRVGIAVSMLRLLLLQLVLVRLLMLQSVLLHGLLLLLLLLLLALVRHGAASHVGVVAHRLVRVVGRAPLAAGPRRAPRQRLTLAGAPGLLLRQRHEAHRGGHRRRERGQRPALQSVRHRAVGAISVVEVVRL